MTATQEAVMLEMEKSHTVAIAMLQDEYNCRVQGSEDV